MKNGYKEHLEHLKMFQGMENSSEYTWPWQDWLQSPCQVTFGFIAGSGYDAFLFYVGLGFGATASSVHFPMVDAEDHTVPEALATRHCALEGECKKGDS